MKTSSFADGGVSERSAEVPSLRADALAQAGRRGSRRHRRLPPARPERRRRAAGHPGTALRVLRGKTHPPCPNSTGSSPRRRASPATSTSTMRTARRSFRDPFHGNLTVAAEGEYTFFTTSDDGAQLPIDDKPVVDNSGIHAAQERSGRIVLKRGEHAVAPQLFQRRGRPRLSAPGRAEHPQAGDSGGCALALRHPHGARGHGPAFTVDPAKAEQGRAVFRVAQLRVVPSDSDGIQARHHAKPLANLDAKRADSCIGEHAARGRAAVRRERRGPSSHPGDAGRAGQPSRSRSPPPRRSSAR